MGDDLYGSLSRLATAAARAARSTAEAASSELSGVLGDAPVRWPAGLSLGGPVVPMPYKAEGQRLSWQDGCVASCAVSTTRVVQRHGVLPATAALAGLQVLAHLRPGGYQLKRVGLNAHRVLRHGEWSRCASSLAVHWNLPQLAVSASGLVAEGLPLEARLGSARLAALALSCAALSQGLYLGAAWLAARYAPRSSLADEYYGGFTVGASGVALALKVVAGYMRDADKARARVAVPEEDVLATGRLAAWPTIALAPLLMPSVASGASPVGPQVCGIVAGVLHVYGARAAAWLWRRLRGGRRRLQGGRLGPAIQPPAWLDLGSGDFPGLGWEDLAAHALLCGGTLLVAAAAARARQQ